MRWAGIAAMVLAAEGLVYAQNASTGAIGGRVLDVKDGKPLAGVTVVAQGPQGEKGELTDDDGQYTITDLVPGAYVVRFYYGEAKSERPNVDVLANHKATVNLRMNYQAIVYDIPGGPAPHIDINNQSQTWRVDQKTIKNV